MSFKKPMYENDLIIGNKYRRENNTVVLSEITDLHVKFNINYNDESTEQVRKEFFLKVFEVV